MWLRLRTERHNIMSKHTRKMKKKNPYVIVHCGTRAGPDVKQNFALSFKHLISAVSAK